jgi:hypothetical protein
MIPFLTFGEFNEWHRYRLESIAFPLSAIVHGRRWLFNGFCDALPYEAENCVALPEVERATLRRCYLYAKDERPSIRQEVAA